MGAFFFGYTLNAMLGGFIYGLFLYKQPIKVWKILIAEILVKLLINCGLGTLWNSMTIGKAFMVLLPERLLKNFLQIPVDTIILFFVLTLFQKLKRHLFPQR